MEDALRNKFAPRRNKRYAHVGGLTEEAEWSNSLDWRNNDYDFFRLSRSIVCSLDSRYRGKFGIRIDQVATRAEIWSYLRGCRVVYEEEESLFQIAGIYVFLHLNMECWLGNKIRDLLAVRRQTAEGLHTDKREPSKNATISDGVQSHLMQKPL